MDFILGMVFFAFIIWTAFRLLKKAGRAVTTAFDSSGNKVMENSETVRFLDISVTHEVPKKKKASAKPENFYNKLIAEDMGIKAGVKLDNGLVADMISDTHAYEIDFGGMKTYEGIGQCLVYAYFTELKPGLIILIRDEKEEKLFKKIKPAIPHLGIDLIIYRVTDRTTGEYIDYVEE